MATGKTQPLSVIANGNPVFKSMTGAAAILPGLLLVEGASTIDLLGAGAAWHGAVAVPSLEVGQGLSAIYANNDAYASGASVRYGVADLASDIYLFAKHGEEDITAGDPLECAGAGLVRKQGTGTPILVAMESLAVSGLTAHTLIKCRRLAVSNSPKVYRALVAQSGTDDPVATVLENTLGGVPVWTRENVGRYRVTLAGAFPTDKTLAIFSPNSRALTTNIICGSGPPNANEREIHLFDDAGAASELDTSSYPFSVIEILVYE